MRAAAARGAEEQEARPTATMPRNGGRAQTVTVQGGSSGVRTVENGMVRMKYAKRFLMTS